MSLSLTFVSLPSAPLSLLSHSLLATLASHPQPSHLHFLSYFHLNSTIATSNFNHLSPSNPPATSCSSDSPLSHQLNSKMGLLDHVGSTISKAGGGSGSSIKSDRPPSADDTKGAAADDTEELDEEAGNILMSLVGQLRIGMDLSKVTLPTFVLEPRSMLERITVSLRYQMRRKRQLERGESFSFLIAGQAVRVKGS